MVIPTGDYGNMFLTGCDVNDLGDLDSQFDTKRFTKFQLLNSLFLKTKEKKKRPYYYGSPIWKSLPAHCQNEEDLDVITF